MSLYDGYYETEDDRIRKRRRESEALLRSQGYVRDEFGDYHHEKDILKPVRWINENGDIEESM